MAAAKGLTAKGKDHACKTCGAVFPTIQELGVHVYKMHPEGRKPRHRPRRVTRVLALEITVRMKAEPSEMMRIELPAANPQSLEELYRKWCRYITNRPD